MCVLQCLARPQLGGKQPRDYLPDFGTLNAQSTRHEPGSGPKLAPWSTRCRPARPAADSAREDARAPEKGVQMLSPQTHLYRAIYYIHVYISYSRVLLPHPNASLLPTIGTLPAPHTFLNSFLRATSKLWPIRHWGGEVTSNSYVDKVCM